ncbi:MAG: hypothetical protein AB7N24_17295 [Dehalococcoidia bacterium]
MKEPDDDARAPLVTTLVELTGGVLTFCGLWMVFPPVALVAAGVAALLWALGHSR